MSDIPLTAAPSEPLPPKRRYFLLAFVLSLVSVGVGHLYVGRTKRGWSFAIAVEGAVLILAVILQTRPAPVLLALFLILGVFELGTWLYGAVDAAIIARRRPLIERNARARWTTYLLLIAANVAVSFVTNGMVKHVVWRSFNIPSGSMQPTLRIGDLFVVWREYFVDHEPQRGDIATILMPQMNNTIYVKRIVGLPGDRVQMLGGRLYLNGEPVVQEAGPESDRMTEYRHDLLPFIETLPDGRRYEIGRNERNGMLDDTPVFTVPVDSYFVLGDNRTNSLDSRVREVGFVPREHLQDLALFVFWPHDWHRIGQTLE